MAPWLTYEDKIIMEASVIAIGVVVLAVRILAVNMVAIDPAIFVRTEGLSSHRNYN